MNRYLMRSLHNPESDRLTEELLRQQYVNPHATVLEAVEKARQAVGFCPNAGQGALEWLHIDRQTKIGRLRRTELLQLARTIGRLWRQARQSQPV